MYGSLRRAMFKKFILSQLLKSIFCPRTVM